MARPALSPPLAAVACALAACSTSPPSAGPAPERPEHDAAPLVDAGSDEPAPYREPSAVHPAFAPAAPSVVRGPGAPLASPRFVPVFFPDYPYEAELTDFLAKLAASSTWRAMVGEYGVGAATLAPAVHVAAAPPSKLAQADVVAWLASELDGTHPEWGEADAATLATTVYLLFYPAGTTITMGAAGYPSCTTFAGFHDDAALTNGRVVQYAVLPLCDRPPSLLDALTAVTSHELAEATTDPQPSGRPAYSDVDPAFFAWSISGFGGEVGDLCEARASSFFRPADVGFRVQRTWSNSAAAAHHDPCAPVPGGAPPYFAAAPAASDPVDVLFEGAHVAARGLLVPVGQTRTIDVQLWSDAPTDAPWSVAAYEILIASDGTILPRSLELSLDEGGGGNGDVLHLTVTANGSTSLGASFVRLDSRLGSATQSWFLAVGTPSR